MSEVLFGLAGIVLSVAMLYHTFRICGNFQRHTDLTIALMFPHRYAQVALELAVAGFLVIAAGMVVGAAGLVTGNGTLDLASRALVATGLLGWLAFLRTMKVLTQEG